MYLIMLQFHLANGLCHAQDEVAGGIRWLKSNATLSLVRSFED